MDYYHIYSYTLGARNYEETVVANGFKEAISLLERHVPPATTLEITKHAPSGFVTKMRVGGSLQKSPPRSRANLPPRFAARFGQKFMMNGELWWFETEYIEYHRHAKNGPHKASYYIRNLSGVWLKNPLSITEPDTENVCNLDPKGDFKFSISRLTKNFDPCSLVGRWNFNRFTDSIMLEKEVDFITFKLLE